MTTAELQRALLEALFVTRQGDGLSQLIGAQHRLEQGIVEGDHTGVEGMLAFFERAWPVFDKARLQDVASVDGSDLALTRATVLVKHTGKSGVVSPTFRWWRFHLMLVSRARQGRLVETRVEGNLLVVLGQMQAWQVPDAALAGAEEGEAPR